MARKHLNQRIVDGLKTEKNREDVWDGTFRVRGIMLGIRVTKQGLKTYFCRYREPSGTRRRVSLGDAKTMSLREAHEKARTLSALSFATSSRPRHTPSPVTVVSTPALEPAFAADEFRTTFGALCEEYLACHAVHKKDGGKADARLIRHDLLPCLGEMDARKVRRRDVIAVLDHIALERGAQVMANRTRALLSKIFNFGIEREIVSVSPCVGLPRKRREKPKERFLDDSELLSLWQALEHEPLRLANIFKLVVLTGQRPGEVSRARWSEFEGDVWIIPSERVKNGRTHRVPLSQQALQLLEVMRVENGVGIDSENGGHSQTFVFRSAVRGSMSTRTIHQSLKRVNHASGLKHFTLHDLRRTCATGLRRIGVSRETVSRVLNHTNRSVTLTYDWYDELPEMRAALSLWGKWLDNVVSSQTCSTEMRQFLNHSKFSADSADVFCKP